MFDMDGTLLFSMRYWRLTTIELLLGRDIIPTPEQMSRVFSSSSRALCSEVLREHGIDLDDMSILQELESYMLSHYRRDVKSKPHVHAYLQKLRATVTITMLQRIGNSQASALTVICHTRGGMLQDSGQRVVRCESTPVISV
jgi:beta-phosphoglucomutase-like phosphatase (HAD superfamily)